MNKVKRKRALRRWPRERCETQKLMQNDLARRLRSGQSRIAKMEAGDIPPCLSAP